MENLNNLNDLTSEEKDYFELLVDFLGNGNISESERNILNKRKEKFGISDSRAKELEEFAKQERLANLKPQNDSEIEYYELIFDFLGNGDISESERNILNKRKEKFGISDSRAKELEEFAKQERLSNLKPQNDSEIEYYELIFDFLGNGNISESERNILNKRKEKFGISDSRAKELEEFAENEYLESKKIKFETEGEKDYYEFLVDMLEDGTIDERERNILNKRKEKYGISEARAKELEEFAKLNNGDNSNSLLEEGKAYLKNGEYDKAIEIFKKAVELNPNDYDNWHWLGTSYLNNEQYPETINPFKRAVELNPNNEGNWCILGYSYNKNGQHSEAEECYKKAIELNPNNADNWDSLAGFYNDIKEYNKTIETYKRAIELNPNGDYNWYFNLSFYYEGELNKAIEVLKRAVELNPNSDNNWYWLGISYYDNEQHSEAEECYKKAIELNPNYEGNWSILASLYEDNEEYDKAIECYKKVVELNPDSGYNWRELGEAYISNGEYDKAIECYKKAVKLEPNNSVNWYWLGYSYHYNKQYLDAINSLKKAIELNPDNGDNWLWLGLSYYFNKQYLDAINPLKKAVELNPNNDNDWYFLGNSYYYNEQYLDAINPFKKATELNPNNADNWYRLGLSYHLTEQYSEAEECYRKCLQINPNHEVARELLENLQSANYGISGKSIVSGISKGIDTANELASKVKPETIETITKVGGAAVTAATILGAFFNRNKN